MSLGCPYIWQTYYEVFVAKPGCDICPADIGAKLLQDGLLVGTSDMQVLSAHQRIALNTLLTHIVSSQLSLDVGTVQLAAYGHGIMVVFASVPDAKQVFKIVS